LWHLGPFRVELQDFVSTHSYLLDSRHQHLPSGAPAPPPPPPPPPAGSSSSSSGGSAGSDDLLRALCNVFNQYEYSEDAVVSPDELRNVIGHIYDKFRVGDIADANETLEAILERIHAEWSPSCPTREGGKCIGHTVFGGLLMEQAVCQQCGASSEPMLRSDFVHYVYAAELISLAEESRRPQAAASGSRSGVKDFFKGLAGKGKKKDKGERARPRPIQRGLFSPSTHAGAMPAQPSYYATPQLAKYPSASSSALGAVTGQHPPALVPPGSHFGRLLRQCLAMSPLSCPSNEDEKDKDGDATGPPPPPPPPPPPGAPPAQPPCPGKATVTIHALEAPLALAISVVWTQEKERCVPNLIPT